MVFFFPFVMLVDLGKSDIVGSASGDGAEVIGKEAAVAGLSSSIPLSFLCRNA
jgi:hypothetical protein